MDYIVQFTSSVRHVHGMDNVVADALSRIETNALLTGQSPYVDFTAIAQVLGSVTEAISPLKQFLLYFLF